LLERRKIGLFGGTFDPPHNAHLKLANIVLDKLNLESIYFIPASYHALKNNAFLTSVEIRYEMITAAIEPDNRLKVSRIEMERPTVSYTVDTLKMFREYERIGDSTLYYLLGVDNLTDFQKWKNPEKIFGLAQVVVLHRPGYEDKKAFETYKDRVILLDTPRYDISSTMIRNAIGQGKSVKNLLPHGVLPIIEKYCLYQP
jgi:nicotinate-nucleotide adenylyltransferase